MQKPIRQVSVLVFLMSLGATGCQSDIERAMREIAPPGGTGVKQYTYESGELKLEQHWSRYRITRSRFFRKSGETIADIPRKEGPSIWLELDEDGALMKISQIEDYEKKGLTVEFENDRPKRLLMYGDESFTEVEIATEAIR